MIILVVYGKNLGDCFGCMCWRLGADALMQYFMPVHWCELGHPSINAFTIVCDEHEWWGSGNGKGREQWERACILWHKHCRPAAKHILAVLQRIVGKVWGVLPPCRRYCCAVPQRSVAPTAVVGPLCCAAQCGAAMRHFIP
jgi:hypothetical protein